MRYFSMGLQKVLLERIISHGYAEILIGNNNISWEMLRPLGNDYNQWEMI